MSPSKLPTPCPAQGCPEITPPSEYCEEHKDRRRRRRGEDNRPSAAQRGYDSKWRRASKAYRKKHPICERCADKDPPETRPSELVHHIKPLPEGPRLDPENMVALCRPCHRAAHCDD